MLKYLAKIHKKKIEIYLKTTVTWIKLLAGQVRIIKVLTNYLNKIRYFDTPKSFLILVTLSCVLRSN